MKTREPRRNVVLPARMRGDSGWIDVTIRNISSRGLGMQSAAPPARGTYVEIFRLRHRIVGRVVWSEGLRFGIYTREKLEVHAIISDQPTPRCKPGEPPVERRTRSRNASDDTHRAITDILAQLERSRRTAAALNFGAVTFGGAAAALLLASTVADLLASSMEEVGSHLQQATRSN